MTDLAHGAFEEFWTSEDRDGYSPKRMARAAWKAAIERAWEAVHAERLIDPTEEHGDLVYQRAVEDCENAVFALKERQ